MINIFNRRNRLVSLLTTALVLSFSALAFAGPQRGGSHSGGGHRDGDGPETAGSYVSYHNGDDDDWDRRGDRHRGDWVRDNREVRRRALSVGIRAGFEIGRRDRFYHSGFDYRYKEVYREATLGYRRHYGSLEFYRRSFREGFRQGYIRGYRSVG